MRAPTRPVTSLSPLFATETAVRFHEVSSSAGAARRGQDDVVVRERPASPDDFAVFCHQQHRRVVATIAVYCGDPSLAEEVAQEALAKACEHWPRVRGMEAPGAWLHTVALNIVRSRFRRRKLEQRAAAKQASPDIHTDLDVAELLDLRSALLGLSERRRNVVLLRHVAGLSVTETAAATGMSENSVRSLASRALAELREQLEKVEAPRAR